ncbi:hypothetical protein [Streptomyces cylindrosporus]|uniref:Uncharacterized protein n=1 Tax=Streptomyces cylindrosporus TaxID=2927583 RepID=A0ABS9YJY8_9ACTN|nr:hypothetical protein [Streptomyces cylindrosporus]MCI3277566.1 hypothetical protein [Streptomyces cylindrosporus]
MPPRLERDADGLWLSPKGKRKPAPKKDAVPSAPVIEACHVDGCGTPASGPRPAPGMVRVPGSKDGAAAHWYCPGRCAAIARARTDLRNVGGRR